MFYTKQISTLYQFLLSIWNPVINQKIFTNWHLYYTLKLKKRNLSKLKLSANVLIVKTTATPKRTATIHHDAFAAAHATDHPTVQIHTILHHHVHSVMGTIQSVIKVVQYTRSSNDERNLLLVIISFCQIILEISHQF
jgi:hypothetical protein